MTAPSGGRSNIVRSSPFYANDLSLKVTGDNVGRYTYDSARARAPRPVTAGSGLRSVSEHPVCTRPSTAATRRRYFFPQSVSLKSSSAHQSPFYSHFDVLLPAEDQNNTNNQQKAFDFEAGKTGHQKFYYREYNQHQLEHFAQNRELTPLRVDMQELREWLVTAKPRTAMDAGPLLVLVQNLMKSLLDEKAIVFEKRAEQHAEEQCTVVKQLSERVATLEQELEKAHADRRKADACAASASDKLQRNHEKTTALQKEVGGQLWDKEVIVYRWSRAESYSD